MQYDSAFGQMMHNVFGGFDISIMSGFAAVQNDLFTFLAKVFTCLGEPLFFFALGFMCLIFCLFKRTRKIGLLLGASIVFMIIINDICLKYSFERLRPYNALQGNSEYFN